MTRLAPVKARSPLDPVLGGMTGAVHTASGIWALASSVGLGGMGPPGVGEAAAVTFVVGVDDVVDVTSGTVPAVVTGGFVVEVGAVVVVIAGCVVLGPDELRTVVVVSSEVGVTATVVAVVGHAWPPRRPAMNSGLPPGWPGAVARREKSTCQKQGGNATIQGAWSVVAKRTWGWLVAC